MTSKHSNAIKTPCSCGTVHASRKEARRCGDLRLLQLSGSIAGLQQQPQFKFFINGKPILMENGSCAQYTADFSYVDIPSGDMIVEDVKPRQKVADSRDWPLRKALFKALHPAHRLVEIR